MKTVQITVLKREHYPDLVEQYAKPGLGLCPRHQEGDVFESKSGGKPEGLCDDAWRAMQHYVFALAAQASDIYEDRWLKSQKVIINTCPDGFRPVVFKLEAIDDK
jgi:uncharacterized repeat protein (TIGR04076 family)